MQWLRQLISYALTLALIVALVMIVPRFQRLRVDPGYGDIAHLDVDNSLNADAGFRFAQLTAGDPIAYEIPTAEGKTLAVGWIAAMPGQEVSIANQKILVDGRAAKGEAVTQPDRAGVIVPRGHVFVVTDYHAADSVALGFLPAAAIRGKLASLP
jgi:hypothetical protein